MNSLFIEAYIMLITGFVKMSDERIILKWIFKRLGLGGKDWIDLAQDRERCRALVNAVMNLRVS
jgi:hypothetical protein